MCSLLSQMYAAPSEKIDRRFGERKYDPEYNLCRHISLPPTQVGLDPKPPPARLTILENGVHPTYKSNYGVMTHDVKDQFARHWQWKTQSQLNYVQHCPPFADPHAKVPACYEPRADMVTKCLLGKQQSGGPFDYQQLGNCVNTRLPESQAWYPISSDHAPFPHNVYPRAELYKYIRRDTIPRSEENCAKMTNHIRDLVKNNDLNIQFVRPTVHYGGRQSEVRLSESLKKDSGRNPPCMTTEHQAQFGREIPVEEYQRPRYCAQKPLSKSVVLQRPYCHFNQKEYPHTLDYLPMPWNLTKNPTDYRVISGYKMGLD